MRPLTSHPRSILLFGALLACALLSRATDLGAQSAADSALARDVRVQTDSLRNTYSPTYARLHRLAHRIDSIAASRLAGTPATPPAPPAPQPPAPSNPPPSGPSHEPSGMTVLTDRAFARKAATTSDRAGAEGWDPVEGRYANLSIVSDPTAPRSPDGVAQMRYPAGMQAGVAPGLAQLQFAQRKRELYLSAWVKLSSTFYGNQSSTNKMLFVWIAGGARVFISAEGAAMNPLIPQIRLQGKYIPDTRARLLPNVTPGVALKRGQWQRWELRLVANTPGQFDGQVQWWLDGQLISDYRDVAFVAANEAPTWEQFQWSPTYGGGGAGVPYDMTLSFDHVYISGR